MKKFIFKTFMIMSLMVLGLASCKKDNGTESAFDLVKKGASASYVTFSISPAPSSQEIRYMVVASTDGIPEASEIMEKGEKADVVREKTYSVGNLIPEMEYTVAAVDMDNAGNLSKVKTINIKTITLTIEVTASNVGISTCDFHVEPSNDMDQWCFEYVRSSEIQGKDDATIFNSFYTQYEKDAMKYGISLEQLLKSKLMSGKKDGNIKQGLFPDTKYTLLAFGMNYEGKRTSAIGRTEITTNPIEMNDLNVKIEAKLDNLYPQKNASVKLTPSDNNIQYAFAVIPKERYPECTSANEFADFYIEDNKSYLDSGSGLIKGEQQFNIDLIHSTEYVIVAFGYEGARTSEATMTDIKSADCPDPETFDATLKAIEVTENSIAYNVDLKDMQFKIYYGSVIQEKATYSYDSARKIMEDYIKDTYDTNKEMNDRILMKEIVAATCDNKNGDWGGEKNLKSNTEYVITCFAVNLDGSTSDKHVELVVKTK